jgi:hypothetical protein
VPGSCGERRGSFCDYASFRECFKLTETKDHGCPACAPYRDLHQFIPGRALQPPGMEAPSREPIPRKLANRVRQNRADFTRQTVTGVDLSRNAVCRGFPKGCFATNPDGPFHTPIEARPIFQRILRRHDRRRGMGARLEQVCLRRRSLGHQNVTVDEDPVFVASAFGTRQQRGRARSEQNLGDAGLVLFVDFRGRDSRALCADPCNSLDRQMAAELPDRPQRY